MSDPESGPEERDPDSDPPKQSPTRADLRLYGRALRQRWAIPDDMRGRVIRELGDVLESPTAKPRDILNAIRVLLAADKLNIQQEVIDMKRSDHDARLPIAPDFEAALERAYGDEVAGAPLAEGDESEAEA